MKRIIAVFAFSFCLFQISYSQNESSNTPTTVMEFEDSNFNFGTITSGEKVSHVFKFTNTGDVPLVITNVKGSCGCTVPFYPKVPILPGESSEIEVSYDSKNKEGLQSKRVTITANTDPATFYLSVKGEVLKGDINTEDNEAEIAKQNEIIEDLQSLDKSCFAIFPNPSSDFVQLELKEYIGQSAVIEIRNEMGQPMTKKTVQSISRETTRFDVQNFPAGMYLISISVEQEKPMTQCFVVSGN